MISPHQTYQTVYMMLKHHYSLMTVRYTSLAEMLNTCKKTYKKIDDIQKWCDQWGLNPVDYQI